MQSYIEITFDLECEACGDEVKGELHGKVITVSPCENCLDSAKEGGKEEAQKEKE